jgi:16S rRNA U1498 N3-methylase RsmE
MPAPRLFVDAPLAAGATIDLDADQSGYLGRVLRLAAGDGVRIFNGRDGEWRARIVEVGKRGARLAAETQTRPQQGVPDLVLAFAPVKRQATDWLVEKAVELGVRTLQPVLTKRTIAETVRLVTGSASEIVHLPALQDDPRRRRPDLTRANEVLNWMPTTLLAQGLLKTMEYFREQLSRQ